MTRRIPRNARRLLASLAVVASVTSLAPAQSSDSGIANLMGLAGDDQRVSFRTLEHPDGSDGWFHISRCGEEVCFRAGGSIFLDTANLTLECLRFEYDPSRDLLEAIDDVVIVTPQVSATSQRLTFTPSTSDIMLSGNPRIEADSDSSHSLYHGMETFILRNQPSGARTATMNGGELMTVEYLSKGEADAPAPGPTGSLQRLGDKVTLLVGPREGVTAHARADLSPENDLLAFQARGSVSVLTDILRVRSDELTYDQRAARIEASGNVYLKYMAGTNEEIEADAGRLVYDLNTGTVTLTIAPDVRATDGTRTARFFNYEVVRFRLVEGEDPEMSGEGPLGEQTYEARSPIVQPTPTPTPTRPTDREVDLISPEVP